MGQVNCCLTDIPAVRVSGYTGNATEMRDALWDYVKSPFGKSTWQLDHVRCTGEKRNWQEQ